MILAQITNTNLIPDIARVVHDVSPDMNMEAIIAFLTAVFLVARSLRKLIPDNLQTGKVGDFLKHASLEINPETTTNPNPVVPPVQPTSTPPIKTP